MKILYDKKYEIYDLHSFTGPKIEKTKNKKYS